MIKNNIEKALACYPHLYANLIKIKGNTNPDKYAFLKLIEAGDFVVDGGANIGYCCSLFCKIVGKTGKVHAFEPVLPTYQYLENTVTSQNTLQNYTLNNIGIADKISTETMYMPDGVNGHSSLKNHETTWQANKVEEYEINLTTLDEYLDKLRPEKIDFFKRGKSFYSNIFEFLLHCHV